MSDSMSKTIDKIRARRHGGNDSLELTAEEREAIRRGAEDRALARSATRRADKAEAKRLASIHGALQGVLATHMRHGVTYTAADRDALTNEVAKQLGGASDDVKRSIRTWVDKAADAVAGGDKQTGMKAAADAAEQIAEQSPSVAKAPAVAIDDDPDENDPRALAARIARA
jgi:hypothetical protein